MCDTPTTSTTDNIYPDGNTGQWQYLQTPDQSFIEPYIEPDASAEIPLPDTALTDNHPEANCSASNRVEASQPSSCPEPIGGNIPSKPDQQYSVPEPNTDTTPDAGDETEHTEHIINTGSETIIIIRKDKPAVSKKDSTKRGNDATASTVSIGNPVNDEFRRVGLQQKATKRRSREKVIDTANPIPLADDTVVVIGGRKCMLRMSADNGPVAYPIVARCTYL